MNFSKEDFDNFKKVYDPKEFFIILLIACQFICPAYQIYHEGILDDVYLKTPGVVLNKKHMNAILSILAVYVIILLPLYLAKVQDKKNSKK